MGKRRSLLAPAVLAACLAFAAPTTTQLGPADPQRYLSDIRTLTQPKMEGRGDGSKGLVRAEHVLEARYKSLGLEPAGRSGYLQAFVVTTGAKLKGKNHLVVQNGEGKTELKLHQDYVPFSFSNSGNATATLVFAGFGISAPELDYDDYDGLDVKDKIVVGLRYEPRGFVAKTRSQGMTRHAQVVTKAINARNHGAKALILVNGQLRESEECGCR